jgi:hypothetical protein
MAWRVARSLDVLLDQLNRRYPNRSKASDGSIGDTNHLAQGWEDSDHNPWYPLPAGGIVTARDFTHDPAHGVDIDRLSDELAASRDPRIKYIIANGLILDSRPQFNPWQWVRYTGSNPHDHHLHLSVMDNPSCDDPRPWDLPMLRGDDMPTTQELWDYPIDDPYVGPDGKKTGPKPARVYLAYSAANAAHAVEQAGQARTDLAALRAALPEMIQTYLRAALANGVAIEVTVRDNTGKDA